MSWNTRRINTTSYEDCGGFRHNSKTVRAASPADNFKDYQTGQWSILVADGTFWWVNTPEKWINVLAEELEAFQGDPVLLEIASTIGYTYYIYNGTRCDSETCQRSKNKYSAWRMERDNIEKHRTELSKAISNMRVSSYGGISAYDHEKE